MQSVVQRSGCWRIDLTPRFCTRLPCAAGGLQWCLATKQAGRSSKRCGCASCCQRVCLTAVEPPNCYRCMVVSVQDGKYCLVWGGTHEHSWLKPEKLRDFRAEVPEYTALISSARKADYRAAVEDAKSGRLKEWNRVQTARYKAAPASAAESKQWYWTEEEELALIRLVEEEGSGDWSGKVQRLGTNRSVSSVKSRWLEKLWPRLQANNGKYEFKVPAMFADQPGEPWRKHDAPTQGTRANKSCAQSSAKRAKQTANQRSPQAVVRPRGSHRRSKASQRIKSESNFIDSISVLPNAWDDDESQRLLALVTKSGTGDWSSKAAQLGSNRTGRNVQDHYYAKFGRPQESVPERRFRQPTVSNTVESRRNTRKAASPTGLIDLVRTGHGPPTEAKQFAELVNMGFSEEQVTAAARTAHNVFEHTLQILLNPTSRELQLGQGSYIDGPPAHPRRAQDASTAGAGCAPLPVAPTSREKWTELELQQLRETVESMTRSSSSSSDGISISWEDVARKMDTGRGLEAYRMRWHRLRKQTKHPAGSPRPTKAHNDTNKPRAVASSDADTDAHTASPGTHPSGFHVPRKVRRVSTIYPSAKMESDQSSSTAPTPVFALEARTSKRKEWEKREEETMLRLVQKIGIGLASDVTEWQAVADRLATSRTGTAVQARYRLLQKHNAKGIVTVAQKKRKVPQSENAAESENDTKTLAISTKAKFARERKTQKRGATTTVEAQVASKAPANITKHAAEPMETSSSEAVNSVQLGKGKNANKARAVGRGAQAAPPPARSNRVRKAPERWVNDALSAVNLGGRADLFEKVVAGEVTSQESAKQVKTKDPQSSAAIREAIAQSDKDMAEQAEDAAQAKLAAEARKKVAVAARRTAKRKQKPSRLRRKPAFPRRHVDGTSVSLKQEETADPDVPEGSAAVRDGQEHHASTSAIAEPSAVPEAQVGSGRARRDRKQVQRWADDPLATVDLGGSMDKREAVVTGKIDYRGAATDANWVPPKGWKGGLQAAAAKAIEERREMERQSKQLRSEERAAARQIKQKSRLARADDGSPECRLRHALEHRKHCGWDEDEYVVVVDHKAQRWRDDSTVWSTTDVLPSVPSSQPSAAAGLSDIAVSRIDHGGASRVVPDSGRHQWSVRNGDGGAVPCCVELKNIPTDISWEQLRAYCLSFGQLAALETSSGGLIRHGMATYTSELDQYLAAEGAHSFLATCYKDGFGVFGDQDYTAPAYRPGTAAHQREQQRQRREISSPTDKGSFGVSSSNERQSPTSRASTTGGDGMRTTTGSDSSHQML